jgi:hypothetical protein
MGFSALVEIHLDSVVADKRLAHLAGWLPVRPIRQLGLCWRSS